MKKTISALVIIFIFILLLVTSSMSFAQDIPQVTITANADGLELSDDVAEGLVNFTFDNQSEAPILPVPARLRDDVTRELFLETFEEEGQFAAIALIEMQGGTMIFPGVAYSVTYDFNAGDYVLLNVAADVPSFTWFTIEDSTTEVDVVEPEADVEVILTDFAFGMPLEIEAGEQVWHLNNVGGQWHEMMIIPVAEGTTIEEAQAMMMPAPVDGEENPEADAHEQHDDAEASDTPAEEPPFAFMWIPMETGEQVWLNVDLAPGTYAVGCMLPNLEEMGGEDEPHMHSDLGMVQIIVVK